MPFGIGKRPRLVCPYHDEYQEKKVVCPCCGGRGTVSETELRAYETARFQDDDPYYDDPYFPELFV
jgi:hypothetical protein